LTPLAAGGGASPSQSGVTITPPGGLTYPSLEQSLIPQPFDERNLSSVFPSEALDEKQASIQDYRQTSRQVEGEIIRDPIARTEKAKLNVNIELAVDQLRQLACWIDSFPEKLLYYVEGSAEMLANELGKQLRKRLDLDSIERVIASNPPSGLEGPDL